MTHRMSPPSRILVADDSEDVRHALCILLRADGWEVHTAASPETVLTAVRREAFDVLLLDMNYARDTTSGAEGLALLETIGTVDPDLPIVVMTAFGSVERAVESLRNGARDYVEKPWDNQRLLSILRSQAALREALRRVHQLEAVHEGVDATTPLMIGEAPLMRRVRDLLLRVADADATVLLLGEHGVGKEVAARWLHARSDRANRPMVTVNLGGLSEGIFESELFGHVRGAFTGATGNRAGRFETADDGTLFLDEIANMSARQQATLLRVLSSGEFERLGSAAPRRVRARLVAATNADLAEEVREGRFREDLRYRLNTIEITIPPLRERREDIAPLALAFLARTRTGGDHEARQLAPDAVSALEEYPWPGNVRELGHVIERAVLLADTRVIRAKDLRLNRQDAGALLEGKSLAEIEAWLIERTMARTGGRVEEAARELGISRSALYRRLGRTSDGD